MKILFACGGTAGHINPAVALARVFQERKEHCEILFVGAKGAIEEKLVPQEGFDLETITISPFYRELTWKAIQKNVRSLYRVRTSQKRAQDILDAFMPDLVVGTGGFASYPIVKEASKRNIPTAIHESNAVPGLTTKKLANLVDCVMVGIEDAVEHYPKGKAVVTGTPVRVEFFQKSKKEAKKALQIPEEEPLVLSYFGSLGASKMNAHMVGCIALETKDLTPFHHMHSAGRDYDSMMQALEEKAVVLPQHIQIKEYIYDMPTVMMAADLVLCRAGASTISELTTAGKAAILIPSPYVTNRHQEKNAMVLEKEGGAVVILEENCDETVLHDKIKELIANKKKREQMEEKMSDIGMPDATEKIYQTLINLAQKA